MPRSALPDDEKRKPHSVMLSPAEWATVCDRARAARLSPGTYLRHAGLGTEAPRPVKTARYDLELRSRMLTGLQRMASVLDGLIQQSRSAAESVKIADCRKQL